MPGSQAQRLRERTKRFAVEIVRFCRGLPPTVEVRRISEQLVASATSVTANYHAACRARTRPEFIAKIGTVLEEADETGLWLDLLIESGTVNHETIAALRREAEELTAIFAASLRTARSRR